MSVIMDGSVKSLCQRLIDMNGYEIRGLEELQDRFEGMINPATIERALAKAAAFLEGEAVKRAPSKEIEAGMFSYVEGLTGIVANKYEKAPYAEYGTGLESIHPMGGRKDVPWVYIEGVENNPPSKRKYTREEAEQTVAALKAQGFSGATLTYGSKPQPFLRPALDENREKVVEILREGYFDV